VRKADNLPPTCAVVTKSGSLFLEPSGPLQACNGTDFYFYKINDLFKEKIFCVCVCTISKWCKLR